MKRSKLNLESIDLATRLLGVRDDFQEILKHEHVSLSPSAQEKLEKWTSASRQVAEHLITRGEQDIQISLQKAKARLLAESQDKISAVPPNAA